MRILHVSDLHLPAPWTRVPLSAWLGKRLVGGANLALGRGKYFADGFEKLQALDRFRRERAVDLVVCTGDFTSLGTRWELDAARAAFAPLAEAPLGFVCVPGNHDLYTPDAVHDHRFPSVFADAMTTDLPEHTVDGDTWPFVRLFGDDVAMVGVNSARPRPIWSSSGRIPERQLEALGRILADPRVNERFVFVITHYTPRLADGSPDRKRHGMANADAFLAACANLRAGAILCGHVHRRFAVCADGIRPTIYCAGSTTMAGREGLWLFDPAPDGVEAVPGTWDGSDYVVDTRGPPLGR